MKIVTIWMMIMSKLLRIDSERLVFSSTLRCGVPTVPKWMKLEAEQLCKVVNKTIKTFGGNMDEVWFYFNEELTEEEVAKLEESYVSV